MFSIKAKEELGKLFMNMALASKENYSLYKFIFGLILWLLFTISGLLILNRLKSDEVKKL